MIQIISIPQPNFLAPRSQPYTTPEFPPPNPPTNPILLNQQSHLSNTPRETATALRNTAGSHLHQSLRHRRLPATPVQEGKSPVAPVARMTPCFATRLPPDANRARGDTGLSAYVRSRTSPARVSHAAARAPAQQPRENVSRLAKPFVVVTKCQSQGQGARARAAGLCNRPPPPLPPQPLAPLPPRRSSERENRRRG